MVQPTVLSKEDYERLIPAFDAAGEEVRRLSEEIERERARTGTIPDEIYNRLVDAMHRQWAIMDEVKRLGRSS